jgi:hypothetical protein
MMAVPPEVCKVANATADALPAALVSLVIALAVAVPVDDAPKAVADKGKVATAVPGAAMVEGEIRNTKFPLVPINAVTASVAALRADVLCVTAILKLLQFVFVEVSDEFDGFGFTRFFSGNLKGKP